MIKGKEKQQPISVEEIFQRTNGGYDIFKYYLGNVQRVMQRPWGRKETKLSWGIFPKSGTWFFKDHATEETGNAIHFVRRYFNLSFVEAKDKISWDFGLGGKETNVNPVKVTWEKPNIEKDYVDIRFSSQPFKIQHHNFWNAAEVPESHCRQYECYAVKDLAINKKKINIASNEAVFAFYCPGEDGAKIYFPERDKDKKFRNNVSWHHLWNFDNLKSCKDLIVQKSPKDMIVTLMLTPCVTATQAEAVKIFDKETVDKINGISTKPWIWYGSDWDGVKKCKEITDTHKWKYINTPAKLLPEINDVYGYTKKFKLKGLEEFMKLKKLL